MILPDCYVRNLRMVNLNIPASKGGNLHILLERLRMKRSQDLPLLHNRMKVSKTNIFSGLSLIISGVFFKFIFISRNHAKYFVGDTSQLYENVYTCDGHYLV